MRAAPPVRHIDASARYDVRACAHTHTQPHTHICMTFTRKPDSDGSWVGLWKLEFIQKIIC